MQDLVKSSIHVTNATVTVWPQFGNEEKPIDVTDLRLKFNGAYSVNNSTICFVFDHEVFVTPYTREAMATIRKAGMTAKYFYVPFSNWDYPKYEKAKWEHLLEVAHEKRYHYYEEDCIEWCDDNRIGELSAETMERCFKIPRSGVPVRQVHYETIVYPACGDEYCCDSTVVEKLGCYSYNNGRVVFVYRDGHTYVTRGYWIIEELKKAGYMESDLFVPFSNGEQIIDLDLAAEWDEIKRK